MRLPVLALAAVLAAGLAQAEDKTFKIAFIDPLSGPFANIGKLMLNHIQVPLQDINAKGGILKGTPLQLLQFDSKLAAQESISAQQSAIDQGARVVVTGGSGSSVVAALVGDTVIYAATTVIGSRNRQIDTVNVTELDPKRSLRPHWTVLDGRDPREERLQCLKQPR